MTWLAKCSSGPAHTLQPRQEPGHATGTPVMGTSQIPLSLLHVSTNVPPSPRVPSSLHLQRCRMLCPACMTACVQAAQQGPHASALSQGAWAVLDGFRLNHELTAPAQLTHRGASEALQLRLTFHRDGGISVQVRAHGGMRVLLEPVSGYRTARGCVDIACY